MVIVATPQTTTAVSQSKDDLLAAIFAYDDAILSGRLPEIVDADAAMFDAMNAHENIKRNQVIDR